MKDAPTVTFAKHYPEFKKETGLFMSHGRKKSAALSLVVFVFCLQAFCDYARAQVKNKWKASIIPDFIETEYGGYIGALTIGCGYQFFDVWDTALIYGFVPSGLGGENLHQLSWKNTLKPISFEVYDKTECSLYIGLSIIYCFDSDLFIDQPARYPPEYYPPNAYNFASYIGFSIQYDEIEYYCEMTALHEDLKSWLAESSNVAFRDAFKLGVGLKWHAF